MPLWKYHVKREFFNKKLEGEYQNDEANTVWRNKSYWN